MMEREITLRDYVTDSYRGLFLHYCHEHVVPATHMLFHSE